LLGDSCPPAPPLPEGEPVVARRSDELSAIASSTRPQGQAERPGKIAGASIRATSSLNERLRESFLVFRLRDFQTAQHSRQFRFFRPVPAPSPTASSSSSMLCSPSRQTCPPSLGRRGASFHQPQNRRSASSLGAEKRTRTGSPLPNPPRPTLACHKVCSEYPIRRRGWSGSPEDLARFDQFGMGNYDLDSFLDCRAYQACASRCPRSHAEQQCGCLVLRILCRRAVTSSSAYTPQTLGSGGLRQAPS